MKINSANSVNHTPNRLKTRFDFFFSLPPPLSAKHGGVGGQRKKKNNGAHRKLKLASGLEGQDSSGDVTGHGA